ncbi:uncharacterized protein IL334_007942 [Kwoniella shivajii]|uniref:NADH:flavin oxidoreductase/NADH oxidase N-terminal domain-containing protein n=1 Tax=Kwoniella shivajii TaxID=564305 RepID=A0ABZ1DA32_9TREE|nr:hypothetical protein IL334_007942 [Kwoniella shivajii]
MTIQSERLFEPIKIGDVTLKHRVVMAPMTRLRADNETAAPSAMSIAYYAQRASDGGLIISEGTVPSVEGRGWPNSPGIWSTEQIDAWKKITDAVHAKKGTIFCQLFAAGRVANPSIAPVIYAPSDINDPTPGAPTPPLKVMTREDITKSIADFTQGAKNAIAAGFDGVEIHCANGYLLDQFIQYNSNQRSDEYGGSLENRFRFPLQVISSISSAIGASKVGVRISPFATFQGMRPSDPLAVFIPFTRAVLSSTPGLAYISGLMPRANGADDQANLVENDALDPIRDIVVVTGVTFFVAGGFTTQSAKGHAEKHNDLIAFGRYFTSNPDLPQRIRNDWPLVKYDRDTFYTPGKEGYLDWTEYKAIHQFDAVYP